ncbi:MAG: TetR/AcrR family transcriptional regulator [Clostridia bacterium]|nr:TetR/AcrR family transcriptional regulator [Clostridia bacterium]
MANYKRSDQTKQQIIETASRLFYEKGYTEATVRDICSQSGFSVSRINYHFSSKAELAGVICNQFFHNFSHEIRKAIGNRRTYSLVTEAIALRFLVALLLDNTPSSRFYREIAQEGILGRAFSEMDKGMFAHAARNSEMLESAVQENRLSVYGHIFAAALPAVIKSWDKELEQCGGDREKAVCMIQDVFVGLFMQMLDYKHTAQNGILAMSEAYYQLIQVDMVGLTEVRVQTKTVLSEEDKKRILNPYLIGRNDSEERK